MAVLTFIFKNIRWIALAIGLLGGSALLWNGYQYVVNSAQNEIRIEQYKANETLLRGVIADQKKFLDLQIDIRKAESEITENRDDELEALRSKYQDIVSDDLGSDLKDQAPDSLKELIRRMSAK